MLPKNIQTERQLHAYQLCIPCVKEKHRSLLTSNYKSVKYDGPGDCSRHLLMIDTIHLTLMMTPTLVVETSVNIITNRPCQDYTHPDDQT